jgi:hypothetical protein
MPLTLSGTSGVQDNSGAFISGTAVNSTSGTAITFTSIPSWVKRVTVTLQGVSTNGSTRILVRLGSSGGIESSNYLGSVNDGGTPETYSSGFNIRPGNGSGDVYHGQFILSLINSSTNSWAESHVIGQSNNNQLCWGGGTKALSGVLTQVSVTTLSGTDTFDAGTINILYE